MSEKSPRGRKSKYFTLVQPRLEWISEQIKNGVAEKAIAEAIGITEQTFNNYKHRYPEFLEIVTTDKGKQVLQRLINSGVEAACGQWIEEETITIQLDENGEPSKRQKIITKKYIPPNSSLNQYYTKHFGKDEGFTGDPLALAFKQAKLDFDKAVQSTKDWKEYD